MRIDGTRLVSIKPEMLEMLKNLEVGDTLKGRVLEALGSSIAIRTAGGQIFSAMLQEGVSIQKGAFVELIVSSLADGKIYAEFKPESRDTDLDAKISLLLKQLGLPADEKNTEAANLLIKYKLPVDKETIMNIKGLQKGLESLNQSMEGRVGLMLSGMDIKNTPVDVLNKIVLGWSSKMVNPDADTGNEVIPAETEVVPAELPVKEKADVKPVIAGADNKSELEASIKESALIKKSAETAPNPKNSTEKHDAAADNSAKPMMGNEEAAQENKEAGLLKVLERLGIETASEVKGLAGKVTDILASIKNADMESITYLISKDMEATPKNLGMLLRNLENKDNISQFLDMLQQKLGTEKKHELMEIKESIRKVFLEPRQLEKPEEVKEQLKDIARLGEKLESYLDSSGKKDPEIREALSNLRDNIDFIRNVNEYNNFMQVPVIINGDTTTAKLYVFKEGKRTRAIDPENATVLIALDLKSLGHLESMIGVKGNSVSVTFRVENNSIGSFIDRQSGVLKKAIEEKGYSLSPLRIINLEQPFSLLTLEELINEGGAGKIHFDTRI